MATNYQGGTVKKAPGDVSVVRKHLNKAGVSVDSLGKNREGHVVARNGFFYTHGRTSEGMAKAISGALNKGGLKHTIVKHGEHWANFRGGSSIAEGSHHYVHIKLLKHTTSGLNEAGHSTDSDVGGSSGQAGPGA